MTTITFTGDIAFDEYFEGAYNNPDLCDKEITEFLMSSDHVVANVEGAVTNFNNTRDAQLIHSQNPAALDYMKKYMNVDIVSLANNHMFDNGHVGVKDSMEHAKRANLTAIGAGDSIKDYVASCIIGDDYKIGLISISQPWKHVKMTEVKSGVFTWDKVGLLRNEIAMLKEQGVDYIIAVCHGGGEFMYIPAPYVRTRYKMILDEGVDCIVAHHPHVVENYEFIGGKPVFYSLGNCIFDTDYQRNQAHTEEGVILKLTVGKEGMTWEPMGIRIDRENQCLVHGDVPEIFTEIKANEWKQLWPLQARVSLKRDMKLKQERNEELIGKSNYEVLKYEFEQAKKAPKAAPRMKDVVDGAIKSYNQMWRFASRKDIKNYILEK